MSSSPRTSVAVLVGAAPLRGHAIEVARGGALIAVDGGYRACRRQGLRPDWSVGDWDSLGRTPAGLSLTLPRRKDRSDLYGALRAAYGFGYREIVAYGVTGGRPDHHLASLLDLGDAAAWKGMRRIEARGPEGRWLLVTPRSPWRSKLPRGQRFSVFARSAATSGISILGAVEYPLRSGRLGGGSHGLSNLARGGAVHISVTRGGLLVFLDFPRHNPKR